MRSPRFYGRAMSTNGGEAVKSWRDIEEAALTEPLLYQLVTIVQRGDMTREQALIQAVLGLAMKETQRQAIVELLNTRPPRPLIIVRTET